MNDLDTGRNMGLGRREVLRTYFAKVGTREGGRPGTMTIGIEQLRQKWSPRTDRRQDTEVPQIYEDDQRRAERISRIVSSENSLDKFGLRFRLRGLNLGFRMDGSSDLPGGV